MDKDGEPKTKKRCHEGMRYADKQKVMRYLDMQLRGTPENITYIKVVIYFMFNRFHNKTSIFRNTAAKVRNPQLLHVTVT